MSKYKDEMNKISITEQGKSQLMNHVKINANRTKRSKLNLLSKLTIGLSMLGLVSATAFATGILPSVTDIFSPIFGHSMAQTQIIDQIGRPIGASVTDHGITITAEAIMASKNHVTIVYKLSNEDGSPILLPENVEPTYLMANSQGTDFNVMGGSHGSMKSVLYEDGYYRLIETRTFDTEIPNGRKVNVMFDRIYMMDKNGGFVTLAEGEWGLTFECAYEDMTKVIDVNQTYERDGLKFTVDKVNVSPIAVDVEYTVNNVPEFMNHPSTGEFTEDDEHELYIGGVEIFIHKKDGTTLDLTDAGGGLNNKETYVIGTKGSVLEEILPLDDILSITVGDIDVHIE